MANDYAINYEDDRFKAVESEKKDAISEMEKTYSGMINDSDGYFDKQIQASKDWAETQSKNQQEQTDFAIDQIEQQKEQAKKDYTKEQSGAYVDWQKKSNEYGANAEAEAAQGMQNTGFSESSQVSMYNTYQQRVVAARESYNRAIQNYNNSITEARLQNNSALAEIAYNALQQQLELSLQGFQYKNQLLLDQADKKLQVDQMYHERWQDVLSQINTENALAEQIRQHNESLAEEKRQFDAQMAEEQRQFNFTNKLGEFAVAAPVVSSGGSGGGSTKKSTTTKKTTTKDTSTTIKKDKTSTSTKDSSPKLNLQSVLDAGLGPASASTIAKAVKDNKVTLSVDKKTNTASVKKNTTFNSAALNPSTWLANRINKNKK